MSFRLSSYKDALRSHSAKMMVLGADIVFLVLSVVCLLFLTGGEIHTVSGDFALHYSFAKDIAETWVWPTGDKPWTSGMGPYPPISHYLAALSGLVTGSTISAMYDVAIVSVFACYFLVFRKLISLGNVAGTVAVVAAAAALVGLGVTRSVFGYEVFFNFFYAQMVGEAVLLLFLYALTLRSPSYATLAVSSGIVYALGWLYPQTALLAALGYLSFEFLSFIRTCVRTRRIDRRALVRLGVAGIAMPLAVAANPAFQYMIRVAANNGDLNIGAFNGAIPALAAGVVLLCMAMALLIRDEARWTRSALFFAVGGLSSGGAALLQYLSLTLFHSGSDYAIRKFAFLIVSLLVCMVMLLAMWRFADRLRSTAHPLLVAAVPPLAAVAVIYGLPMSDTVSMPNFLKYQASAVQVVKDSGIPDAMGNTASRSDRLPWYLNNAVTLVDLKMAYGRAVAVVGSLTDATKPKPEKFALLEDPRGIVPRTCVRAEDRTSALELVEASCLSDNYAQLRVGQQVHLKFWGAKPPYLASGWSGYEPTGIWTDQGRATIKFTLPHDRPKDLALVLEGTAFLVPNHPEQQIKITVEPGGSPLLVGINAGNQGKPIVVPIPNGTPDQVTVNMEFIDPVSPKMLGLSNGDNRLLGIFLKSFWLSER